MTKEKKIIILLLSFTLFILLVLGSGNYISATTATTPAKYWLKVNEQRNVVTAYKYTSKRWVPVRAMLCSTGLNGTTPKGTFYTQGKWRWGGLMNQVYGQYCTHITQDILFHSVFYQRSKDPSTQFTDPYNSLGTSASHGCVRLSVMDAKWIYDQCKVGTRITVYRSPKSGPLGKPSGIKVPNRGLFWDPTDPNPSNPYFVMKRPEIIISPKKSATIKYGQNYQLKNYVFAKDPNTFMDLTPYIKVSKIVRYSTASKTYYPSKFSTKKLGTYKVTYALKDPYGRSATKTIRLRVVDNGSAPIIAGATSHSVHLGAMDAVGSVTAKQPTSDRTKEMTIHIQPPNGTAYTAYSYAQGKQYVFNQIGKYMIRYTVKNKYAPYKSSNKTISVNCLEPPPLT